jgi:hypothetical protein
MPPISKRSSPHGSPTVRMSGPMSRFATIVRTMNTPTVTIAAENTGCPTSGRIAMRSVMAPIAAIASIAATTPTGNGNPRRTTNSDVKYAPRIISAGWAKFTTSVAR